MRTHELCGNSVGFIIAAGNVEQMPYTCHHGKARVNLVFVVCECVISLAIAHHNCPQLQLQISPFASRRLLFFVAIYFFLFFFFGSHLDRIESCQDSR